MEIHIIEVGHKPLTTNTNESQNSEKEFIGGGRIIM
jgi:hypothetical protein